MQSILNQFRREFYTERHIQAVKQFLELISTSSNSGIMKQRPNTQQEQPIILKEGYVHYASSIIYIFSYFFMFIFPLSLFKIYEFSYLNIFSY